MLTEINVAPHSDQVAETLDELTVIVQRDETRAGWAALAGVSLVAGLIDPETAIAAAKGE